MHIVRNLSISFTLIFSRKQKTFYIPRQLSENKSLSLFYLNFHHFIQIRSKSRKMVALNDLCLQRILEHLSMLELLKSTIFVSKQWKICSKAVLTHCRSYILEIDRNQITIRDGPLSCNAKYTYRGYEYSEIAVNLSKPQAFLNCGLLPCIGTLKLTGEFFANCPQLPCGGRAAAKVVVKQASDLLRFPDFAKQLTSVKSLYNELSIPCKPDILCRFLPTVLQTCCYVDVHFQKDALHAVWCDWDAAVETCSSLGRLLLAMQVLAKLVVPVYAAMQLLGSHNKQICLPSGLEVLNILRCEGHEYMDQSIARLGIACPNLKTLCFAWPSDTVKWLSSLKQLKELHVLFGNHAVVPVANPTEPELLQSLDELELQIDTRHFPTPTQFGHVLSVASSVRKLSLSFRRCTYDTQTSLYAQSETTWNINRVTQMLEALQQCAGDFTGLCELRVQLPFVVQFGRLVTIWSDWFDMIMNLVKRHLRKLTHFEISNNMNTINASSTETSCLRPSLLEVLSTERLRHFGVIYDFLAKHFYGDVSSLLQTVSTYNSIKTISICVQSSVENPLVHGESEATPAMHLLDRDIFDAIVVSHDFKIIAANDSQLMLGRNVD